jgi:hypothetical protein
MITDRIFFLNVLFRRVTLVPDLDSE